MRNISIIGTVGVPANYGGFESLVENIIGYNSLDDIHYTVYCSAKGYPHRQSVYKNADLKYVPLDANGSQSILYDIISLIKATKKSDVVLILGVSGCCFLPIYRLFSKKRLIINIDGLEHRREKWGKYAKAFLKFSEKMAVKHADVVVADNKGIQDYVKKEYRTDTELIAYGGDHVLCDITDVEEEILEKYGLKNISYSFSLCRIEPENNEHVILEAFKASGKKLFFVGNWNRSPYGKSLLEKYAKYGNIHLLSPIYDVKTLNVLRGHCSFYIHGHSAGGTNPSLVEAMFFGKPILAFDVIYNRETTEQKADYFSSAEMLETLLQKPYPTFKVNAENMVEIAYRRYRWKVIAQQYEALYSHSGD